MTTEKSNTRHGEVDEAVVEQSSVSETSTGSSSPETSPPAAESRSDEHPAEQEHQSSYPASTEEAVVHVPQASESYQETGEEQQAAAFGEPIPLIEENVARPFTDFIEEFRQAEEARLSSSSSEPVAEASAFAVVEPGVTWGESFLIVESSVVDTDKNPEAETAAKAGEAPVSTKSVSTEPQEGLQETKEALATPPAERPVSPLLRPATRLRVPRHARQREEHPAPPAQEKQVTPAPQPEAPVPDEQPRPARRYRFDRPAATTSASQMRSEENKEATRIPVTPSQDANNAAEKEMKESNGHAKQPTVADASSTNGGGSTTESVVEGNHRRRQAQSRQQENEPATPAPVAEASPSTPEPTGSQPAEIPPEDLPPLEYSELQRASSRRRRRRRSSEALPVAQAPNALSPARTDIPQPSIPQAPSPLLVPPRNIASSAPTSPAGPYNIVSGYTLNQMNQSSDGSGPFMSPEPSPARGSTPLRSSLRAVRAEAQRSPVFPMRSSDPAINQLASAVVQAIQTQTDRMVSELRRTNQVPTNVSVSLPPFPSTERVGVFVDVANLLYSARTLRINIDFGKLLDFLRGNRRLVRAQAYCPTSPQSSEDQMFLQAVKGLGYRITTKNYKTFSSGAKKADLDLDLCMDVVRLVDGRAVDCIVLVSGDSDFMPMLDYCSDHGVRVEVAAFDEAMSATLRQSCDLFINLAMLEEIRA